MGSEESQKTQTRGYPPHHCARSVPHAPGSFIFGSRKKLGLPHHPLSARKTFYLGVAEPSPATSQRYNRSRGKGAAPRKRSAITGSASRVGREESRRIKKKTKNFFFLFGRRANNKKSCHIIVASGLHCLDACFQAVKRLHFFLAHRRVLTAHHGGAPSGKGVTKLFFPTVIITACRRSCSPSCVHDWVLPPLLSFFFFLFFFFLWK